MIAHDFHIKVIKASADQKPQAILMDLFRRHQRHTDRRTDGDGKIRLQGRNDLVSVSERRIGVGSQVVF